MNFFIILEHYVYVFNSYVFYTQIRRSKYLALIIKVKISLLPETKISIKHARSIDLNFLQKEEKPNNCQYVFYFKNQR